MSIEQLYSPVSTIHQENEQAVTFTCLQLQLLRNSLCCYFKELVTVWHPTNRPFPNICVRQMFTTFRYHQSPRWRKKGSNYSRKFRHIHGIRNSLFGPLTQFIRWWWSEPLRNPSSDQRGNDIDSIWDLGRKSVRPLGDQWTSFMKFTHQPESGRVSRWVHEHCYIILTIPRLMSRRLSTSLLIFIAVPFGAHGWLIIIYNRMCRHWWGTK